MLTSEVVASLVDTQLALIEDPLLLSHLRALRVRPYPVLRHWDYGPPGRAFTCWTVLEHTQSNTAIAYCDQGFGPSDPWGVVSLSGPDNWIGTDAAWYAYLEDAFRGSPACPLPSPPGYEVR